MAKGQSKNSGNNNFIGIAVLGVGVLAFLVVAYFAYQRISPSTQEERVRQSDVNSFKAATVSNRAEGGERPELKKKAYKRQKSISEKEVSGLWEAKFKSGKALLEMKKGIYRLIIIPGRNSYIRYYSNGHYKITDDLVMLSPNKKWGPPKGEGYNYRLLTNANIPVVAAKYKGKMIWQVPPKEMKIYVPPYHAILDYASDKIMVWSVLE